MKGLMRAAETWLWLQIFLTLLAVVSVGAAFWTCWLALKCAAWVFGL
jgi:hypothetical protein